MNILLIADNLDLKQDMRYYHFQSQAELTIDGVDDKEEMKITDVLISYNCNTTNLSF